MTPIVIAAPHSGSGKTTVTLGIMAALKRRGLRVAPFKVGPDFIDPGYHRGVTGACSVNLDGWMCGPSFLVETFAIHAAASDIAVVEGVMGLFDGIDGVSEAGSTAQIAKLLSAQVVLVVDARSQARSAAAVVKGFASFDPGVKVAAVLFNNVASANHEAILREAMAAALPDVALLGCLPKDSSLAIPSRHLGLMTVEDNPLSDDFLSHLAEVVERHLDLDKLFSLTGGCEGGGEVPRAATAGEVGSDVTCEHRRPVPFKGRDRGGMGLPESIRIAVARDAAFSFLYEDNLRLLRAQGADICFFSPLSDSSLPESISGVYLPGGYPELFAETLAANLSMKESLRAAVESGMPIYAECGGFIYLTRGVEAGGVGYDFVGIFPVRTTMLPRRKALGYREIELIGDGIIGVRGTMARGHEFHYSEMEEMPETVERLYAVSRKGVSIGSEGYRYRNCLASYIHLHFGSAPGIAASFVGHCRAHKTRSGLT